MVLLLALALLWPRPSAGQEIHSQHCLLGCPFGSSATNDLIIRDIYILSSNDATKLADWVSYRVEPKNFGKRRKRTWQEDPWLDASETLERGDYRKAHSVAGYDRGHQAPLGSFSASRYWYQTNFLSNITPQRSALNQGPWRVLEERIRKLARRQVRAGNGIVYVMTGPIYDSPQKPLPAPRQRSLKEVLNDSPFGGWARDWLDKRGWLDKPWLDNPWLDRLVASARDATAGTLSTKAKIPEPLPSADEDHRIPSHYWKVVGVQGWPTIKIAAFIMPQTARRKDSICQYAVPLAQVERATDLMFYHRLGTVEKSVLAARRGKLLPLLGCK